MTALPGHPVTAHALLIWLQAATAEAGTGNADFGRGGAGTSRDEIFSLIDLKKRQD